MRSPVASTSILLNYFQGAQCEKCQRFFVGDPADGGTCVPCLEYCHGHSSICVDNSTELDPEDHLYESVKEGPKADAICLNCSDLTSGSRCDECIIGKSFCGLFLTLALKCEV